MGVTEWRIERLASVDSTNRLALDRARQGEPPGLVLSSAFQSEGRGRQGRTWDAPPGSALLFSVLLPPTDAMVDMATRAMALAVREACRVVAGVDVGLKWPNDVLVGQRKLAGILAAADSNGGKVAALVVGCGLNVRSVPPGHEATAAFLDELWSGEADIDLLLSSVLDSLGAWLEQPARVADEFRQRCVTLGQSVTVSMLNGEQTAGTAVDVDDRGALRLRRADGYEITITAGDVVHLRRSP